MPPLPILLPLVRCDDPALCGGKAINLGRMLRAELPVPDGFVVTTAAYRSVQEESGKMPEPLVAAIIDAYRRLGSPAVAVRSSATAEDLAEASMAGQYETILDVTGEEAVIAAVERCWQSVESERLRSYLAEQRIEPESVAMAVVVQRLVPADVAGVLFTANPRTAARDEMVIEAAWGLGEAVVSGMVQPDVIVLDRESGRQKSYAVAEKTVWIEPGHGRPMPVEPQRRGRRCLTEEDICNLWDLANRVVDHFGGEQDIEWAIADGRPVLLQSRAITTLADAEAYRECLDETRLRLSRRKAEGRGDWVRHNIAETLPHPTPLSWSVIGRFMSPDGGFGSLYRMVGFEPSARVSREGFLELIVGRISMDLTLAPEMYFDGFPFRYDTDLLRCRPDAAAEPPTIPTGTWFDVARAAPRLAAIEDRLAELAADCDRRLREQVVPDFEAWVAEEKQRDLVALSPDQWRDVWTQRENRVMDRLAPEVLLPSMIVAMGLQRLRLMLEEHCWDDAPGDLLNVLAIGERADGTIESSEALRAIGCGGAEVDDWLADYGHRGPEEFDLAAPRWRERPEEVRKMAAMLARGERPAAIHHERLDEARRCADKLRARLSRRDRRRFDMRLALVQRYLPWREDGKAVLMLGYDLLRDLAVEAGRRLGIGSDVFLLTLEEVRQALGGSTVAASDDSGQVEATTQPASSPTLQIGQTIRTRRRRRAAEKRISVPLYLGSDEIENLGQPPKTTDEDTLTAVPISTGSAAGPVRILRSPCEADDLEPGYVLVCPSTDPSWTPLLVDAAGLVIECGGMLSHGAVVARELGIPAVVLPEATVLLHEGQRVLVDGQHGVVVREAAGEGGETDGLETKGKRAREEATRQVAPDDVRIAPERIPPPRGPGERRAAMIRGVFFLVWGVYLAAVFLSPWDGCYDRSIQLLDAVLWPLVPALGKPGTVAVLAAGLALSTMIGQRLLTDNRRLLAAKQRAADLRREAMRLPAGSARRAALQRAARGVQPRLLAASLVPLAVLLGPMVMSFVWLPERVDPASWNPPPGAVAFVTAEVDDEHAGAIRLESDSALELDQQTPAEQAIRPIRATLAQRLTRWRQTSDTSAATDSKVPPAMVDDLQGYLDGRIPPQKLAWTLQTPKEPGRYPLAVTGVDGPPLGTALVLGDRFPPEAKKDLADGRGPIQVVEAQTGSPIRRLAVAYQFPRTVDDRVFFAPLRRVSSPALERRGWTRWDAGWLLTYVAAYLLTLMPLRWLLRIP